MMASFMSYFTGRRDSKQTARDAIVSLREQLMMIEKKEEHLQRQITQDLATAKANAVSNKNGTHAPASLPLPWNGFPDLADWVFALPFLFHRLSFAVVILNWCGSGHCCAQTEKDAPGGPR